MTDHIVYVDAKAKARDLEELIEGTRIMIIRGATGRKLPYGRVNEGDMLYLIRNNAEGLIRAKCEVKSVLNSDKMDKNVSSQLVEENQDKLNLTPKQFTRWAGKRYLCLIEIENIHEIEPISFDKSAHESMDDWLIVGDIDSIKK